MCDKIAVDIDNDKTGNFRFIKKMLEISYSININTIRKHIDFAYLRRSIDLTHEKC